MVDTWLTCSLLQESVLSQRMPVFSTGTFSLRVLAVLLRLRRLTGNTKRCGAKLSWVRCTVVLLYCQFLYVSSWLHGHNHECKWQMLVCAWWCLMYASTQAICVCGKEGSLEMRSNSSWGGQQFKLRCGKEGSKLWQLRQVASSMLLYPKSCGTALIQSVLLCFLRHHKVSSQVSRE